MTNDSIRTAFALILIPCLALDPALAGDGCSIVSANRGNFQTEALNSRPLSIPPARQEHVTIQKDRRTWFSLLNRFPDLLRKGAIPVTAIVMLLVTAEAVGAALGIRGHPGALLGGVVAVAHLSPDPETWQRLNYKLIGVAKSRYNDSHEDAEDSVSEMWLMLVQKRLIHRVNEPTIMGWLVRVLINHRVDRYRLRPDDALLQERFDVELPVEAKENGVDMFDWLKPLSTADRIQARSLTPEEILLSKTVENAELRSTVRAGQAADILRTALRVMKWALPANYRLVRQIIDETLVVHNLERSNIAGMTPAEKKQRREGLLAVKVLKKTIADLQLGTLPKFHRGAFIPVLLELEALSPHERKTVLRGLRGQSLFHYLIIQSLRRGRTLPEMSEAIRRVMGARVTEKSVSSSATLAIARLSEILKQRSDLTGRSPEGFAKKLFSGA